MDIEIKDSSNQWKVINEDWTPEWKNESGGDNRCSANIKFTKALKDITGLRIRIKEANFTWGKIAVRELEVFEDYSQKIEVSNPSDYVANIKYNRNTLEKVLFKGKELVENEDYAFSGENNSQITIFGTSLVKDGVDSGAKLEFVFNQGDSYVETSFGTCTSIIVYSSSFFYFAPVISSHNGIEFQIRPRRARRTPITFTRESCPVNVFIKVLTLSTVNFAEPLANATFFDSEYSASTRISVIVCPMVTFEPLLIIAKIIA